MGEVIQIKHDGPVVISSGRSRKDTKWVRRELYWSEMVTRFATPTRTPETAAEYAAMKKVERDALKDVGGFVGGPLRGGRRKADAVLGRCLLTLDLDNLQPDDDPWAVVDMVLGCAAIEYSTHSHTQQAPRLRLIFPLSREVTPEEYPAIARRIAADIGIEYFDDTTYEPVRLMYYPSCSVDAEYVYKVSDGPWLDPDEVLSRYHDWRDAAEWPVSSRQAEVVQRLAAKQKDPTEKVGIVGAFCQVYSVQDAIEEFLPEVYVQGQDGRYTYTGGSTANGLVIYQDGLFAYSHHATDPAGGKLCNAFDLVRLHMFGELDKDSLPDTPAGRLPSYRAMKDAALKIPEVAQKLHDLQYDEFLAAFDEGEEDADPTANDWMRQLALTDKGQVAQTVNNALIILRHDPRLADSYYRDEFRERMVVCGDLPWQLLATRPTDQWTDTDDAGLHGYLETRYGLANVNKITDALDLAMAEHRRHPVREYLEGLSWDEEPRLETLFCDFLGAEDTPYTRAVTRAALIGAVARIFRPGCKHDHMLVLVGPQGCRKSTTLMRLGMKWFSDSLYTVAGKEAYEQIQGYWIIELGEMAATRKAELEQIKQFISKQADSYRAAYARRTVERPRQCAFFGTTNDDEFLRDPTGGRRFWPVTVTEVGRRMGDALTPAIVDQVWAEAVTYFRRGEKWYLDDDMEDEARKVQAAHTEQDSRRGMIEQFLEQPVPEDWEDRTKEERLDFVRGFESGLVSENDSMLRQTITAIEVHVECFGLDMRSYTKAAAREYNNILRQLPGWAPANDLRGPYGHQRGFRRT